MNQKQIWDNIAEEWFEFKNKPSERITEFLAEQKGKVLDLGSGAGRHLMKITDGEMYLVDFSKEMIKFAKQRLKKLNKEIEEQNKNLDFTKPLAIPQRKRAGSHLKDEFIEGNCKIQKTKTELKKEKIDANFKVAPIYKIPYEDNFFDSAICIATLHCVEKEKDREKTIQELYRVLKPKAQAKIVVWNKGAKRFKNAPKEKFVKWRNKGERYYYLYDEKEIHDLFKKAGFKIIKKWIPARQISFIVKKD